MSRVSLLVLAGAVAVSLVPESAFAQNSCTPLPSYCVGSSGGGGTFICHNGKLTADEVWQAGSHRIIGDVIVPAGITLTVEPGASVTLGGGSAVSDCQANAGDSNGTTISGLSTSKVELIVEGSLKVGVTSAGVADPTKPVVFSPPSGYQNAGTWGGIYFAASSTGHVFKNADVGYGNDCIMAESTSGLTIEDTSIHHCYQRGIHVRTTAANVTFRGSTDATAAPGGARAKIQYTSSSAYGYGIENNGALSVVNAEISNTYKSGIYSVGNSQIVTSLIHDCGYSSSYGGYGVEWRQALPSGNQSLTGSVIYNNLLGGLYAENGTTGVTYYVDHNTFDNNDRYTSTTYEVYLSASAGTNTVQNNIVGNNRYYGFYLYSYSTTYLTYANNNSWANGYSNYLSSVNDKGGHIYCNPLFVDSANGKYRLTKNSPARMADNTASKGDLGALIYTNDLTVGLQGILRADTYLTAAGSPYTMPGDLVVSPGVTLTVDPGVVINPATSDNMRCNADSGRVELIVNGTLDANGSSASKITFQPASSTSQGSWYGINFGTTSVNNVFNYVDVNYGSYCLRTSATRLTVSNSRVQRCQYDAVTVDDVASSLTFTALPSSVSPGASPSVIANNSGYGVVNHGALSLVSTNLNTNSKGGVFSDGNSQLISNDIAYNGGSYSSSSTYGYGVYFQDALSPSGNQSMQRNTVHDNYRGGLYLTLSNATFTDFIDHNTFDNNDRAGSTSYYPYEIYAYAYPGNLTISNNILANNLYYGLYNAGSSSPAPVIKNNVYYRNAYPYYGTGTPGAAYQLCNPLWVKPSTGTPGETTNYAITNNSPSRYADSNTPAGDIGAVPNQNDATVDAAGKALLVGVLRKDTFLVTSGSPYSMPGDVVVPNGVTLYIDPGVKIEPTPNTDMMGCNLNTSRAELIIQGSLDATSDPSNRIVIEPAGTSTAYGQWEGVRFDPTATGVSVNGLDILYGGTCMDVRAPGITLQNTRIDTCSAHGVYVGPAPASLTMTGTAGKYGGNFLLESSVNNTGLTGNTSYPNYYGVFSEGGDLTLSNTDVGNSNGDAVRVEGKASLISNRIHNSRRAYGVYVDGLKTSTAYTIQKNLIYSNWSGGIYANANDSAGLITTPGTLLIDHNTIDSNNNGSNSTGYGVYLYQYSGGATTFTIKNNLVTNSQYGLYRQGSVTSPTPNYNDLWPMATGYQCAGFTSCGTKTISNNPLYNFFTGQANVTSSRDFRLQPPSPARNGDDGTPAGDLGALPYYAIPVDKIVISPAAPNVKAAGTQTFSAQAYEGWQAPLGWTPFPIYGLTYAWAVGAGGGTISNQGVFTAGCTLGTYTDTIQATAGGVTGKTDAKVVPGDPAAITVTPATVTLNLVQQQPFTASAKDSCGNATTANVIWSITDPQAGVIDSNGVFTSGTVAKTFTDVVKASVLVGSTTVAGYATVTVKPDPLCVIDVQPTTGTVNINTSVQFSAIGKDKRGNIVSVTPAWSLNACTLGSIDASSGLFTAGSTTGTCVSGVVATAQGVDCNTGATATVTGNATARVVNYPPACIKVDYAELNPDNTAKTSTLVKGTLQFKATAYTDAGCSLNPTTPNATWTVTGTGNTVDATGKVTAGCGTGSFTVTATLGTLTPASKSFTINPSTTVGSVTISPTTASVAVNASTTFTAQAKDICSNVMTTQAINYAVVAGGGTITQGGIFTAGGQLGTFNNTIQASAGGQVATASVTVTAGPLASMTITPSTGTVQVGKTITFTAAGKDSAGNPVTVTPTWSTSVAGSSITSGGVFTAGSLAGSYATGVTATQGGITATAGVNVTPGTLATITVTPAAAQVSVKSTQQYTATGKDSGGNVVPITVTWSATASAGTIDQNGLFTAGTTTGTFTNGITATDTSGIKGQTNVEVTPGPVAVVTINPDPASVKVGTTQQFTATAKDSAGNLVTTSFTWSTTGGGTFSTTTNGLFTAATTLGTNNYLVSATASNGVKGSVTLTLTPDALSTITVAPSTTSLKINATQQFTATGKDRYNNPVTFTPTWSTTATGSSIDPSSGLFTAGTTPGSYTGSVKATSGTIVGTASVTVTAGDLAALTISPNPASVVKSNTVTFTATGKDSAGNAVTIPAGSLSWSVTSPAAGSINSTSGLFTAGSTAGTYTDAVRATSGTVTATATVQVTNAPLASITVSPSTATVKAGGVQQFTASGTDTQGNPVSNLSVSWTVSAGTGSIDAASGLYQAPTAPGTATVRATSGSISGSASVTITAGDVASLVVSPDPGNVVLGQTQQFTATAKDAFGNTVSGAPIAWTALAAAGTISTSGLFTAGSTAGTYANAVTATSGTVSKSVTVNVTTGPLASLVIAPSTARTQIGTTIQFTATGKDANGNVVPATVTWSMNTAAAGTIDPSTGLFTASMAAGTYTTAVRAQATSSNGSLIVANRTVTVDPGPAQSIVVSPKPVNLGVSGTQQMTVVGKDAGGNTVQITGVTWSVVTAAAGTIDASTGMFTAGTTAGNYAGAIKATYGTMADTADVNLGAGTLANMTIAPNPANVPVGTSVQFTAAGTDAVGNAVTVTPVWSVVAGGGSISASGLFTAGSAAGTFTNTVKAASGSVVAYATVTVQAGSPASITLTPVSATVNAGQTQQFTAVVKDSSGNVLSVSVSWSMTNASAGTIDGNGLFTAGGTQGTFSNAIKAQSGTVYASATVTVKPGPAASLTISPVSPSVAARGTQQFTAVAKDAYGNTVAASPTWSVTTALAGTITQTGVYTAGSKAGVYPAAVKAVFGQISDTADVTVIAGALDHIQVNPATASLQPGQSQTFTAEGFDLDNNALAITPTWSLPNSLAGSIDQTGRFTAGINPATYQVKATSGVISGFGSVTVTTATVVTLTVTPATATVAMKKTQAFVAKGFDSRGQEVRGVPVTWTIENNQGSSTINGSTGLFTAGVEAGSATVKATMQQVSGTAQVTIPLDFDADNLPDPWEVANGLDPTNPADALGDLDNDKLKNVDEFLAKTNPQDGDSDDDGVLDGNELKPGEDTDGDGKTNANDADADNDGILDGTEMAVTQPISNAGNRGTDLTKNNFRADTDDRTSTDPLAKDTDGDTLDDGVEDLNHNGKIDPGETDPNSPDKLCPTGNECAADKICVNKVCVNGSNPNPGTDGGTPVASKCNPGCVNGQTCNESTGTCETPSGGEVQESGCGCSSTGSAPLLGFGLLALGMALSRRRRTQ